MNANHEFDTYPEYLLFLFIHTANADYSFKGAEVDVILNKMEVYFQEGETTEELHDLFVKMKDAYDKLGDYDIKTIIFNNYKKFSGKGGNKDRIFIDLHEIISADGYIHEDETRVIEELKILLR